MHRAFVTMIPSFFALIFLVCVSVPSPTWSRSSLFSSVGPNDVKYNFYLNDWGPTCFHSRNNANKLACALVLFPIATGLAFLTIIFSILGLGSRFFTALSSFFYCLTFMAAIIAFVIQDTLLLRPAGLPENWKVPIENISGFSLALCAVFILLFGFGGFALPEDHDVIPEDQHAIPEDHHAMPEDQPQSHRESGDDHDHERGTPPIPLGSRPSIHDILLLFGIIIMLIWPWFFLNVVWAKKGIQMNHHTANVVKHHPHATTYTITIVCTIVSIIVTAFFSRAIVRLAQELVTYRPTRPFHLGVLLALRHQSWPWGKSRRDIKYLMSKGRWWPTVLVIICILTVPHLVSTTTSLITPIPFNRTASLSGAELDFSSTDPVCLDWFEARSLHDGCDWMDKSMGNCRGKNQMVDVLQAGRGHILELVSNKSQSLIFTELGAKNGLRFLGPIRGVLPIGPDVVPGFNTLKPSPLSDPEIMAAVTSYDYTLNHQGLTSNVSCSYQPTSPIVYTQTSAYTGEYGASCAALGEIDVLTNVSGIRTAVGQNTLMYWACRSAPNNQLATSYSIYLRGLLGYQQNVGNMTCTLSLMQPVILPVTYQSTRRIFSAAANVNLTATGSAALHPSTSTFSLLVNYTLIALGAAINQGQGFGSNLIAESVIAFGVESFGKQPDAQTSTYLRLYEQMIQGILEYETTYIRSVYSSVSDPPPSCIRTVVGFVNYEVLGWFVTTANFNFLIPLTLINAASLAALLFAMTLARVVGYLHPFHPRPITYHPKYDDDEVPDEWKEKVAFQPTSILKEHFDQVGYLVEGGIATSSTQAIEEVAR